jgi:phosphoenolpyruvate carboxylase
METFALTVWATGRTLTWFPLFESVDDLLNAHNIMEQLYTNPMYANHLIEMKQTIMLGFATEQKTEAI